MYRHLGVSLFGGILSLLKRKEKNNRKRREASCPFKNISLTETGEIFVHSNRRASCSNQKTFKISRMTEKKFTEPSVD